MLKEKTKNGHATNLFLVTDDAGTGHWDVGGGWRMAAGTNKLKRPRLSG
jgi:hypothetical protein